MRRYDYDRLPTTGERIGGFVAALVLFLLSIATVVVAVRVMLPRDNAIGALVATCVALMAATWSLSLMGRILHGRARRPGFVGFALMGAILLALGVASLLVWVKYGIADAWKVSIPALALGYAFLRLAVLKRNGST